MSEAAAMGQARARGEGGIRFVKSRNGLYGSIDGRFEIERFEAGTRIQGLSGLNNALLMLAGTPFWVAFECEDGKRHPIAKATTLRAARGHIAAHVAGAAAGAVGA